MLDATKDIVIALINSKQISCNSDTDKNIKEVKTAIKEIYQELKNTNLINEKIN